MTVPSGRSLPSDRYFKLDGNHDPKSTTTYSEDVVWFVMKSQSTINKKDLAEVEKSAEQHACPLYALDRRFILRSF